MQLKITTWNINSVRLRIDLVAKFLKAARPDILCLQETKCPDDAFPRKRFLRLGYEHMALSGQRSYHGVAVLSRLPIELHSIEIFLRQDRLSACGRDAGRACRPARPDRAARLLRAGRRRHSRSGGRRKFDDKLAVRGRDATASTAQAPAPWARGACRGGDLHVRRAKHTCGATGDARRRLPHAGRGRGSWRGACAPAAGSTRSASLTPEDQRALHMVGPTCAPTGPSDRGRRLDHIWVSPDLADRVSARSPSPSRRAAGSVPPTTSR